jgi:hypothetical protein
MKRLPRHRLFGTISSSQHLLPKVRPVKTDPLARSEMGRRVPSSAARYALTDSHRCVTRGGHPNSQELVVISSRVAARNQR